jgi:hypothetical protein
MTSPTPAALRTMSDLAASLEALFRRYSEALDLRPGELRRLEAKFRNDMNAMVAEFGKGAVDKAIAELPDERWPSVSLH